MTYWPKLINRSAIPYAVLLFFFVLKSHLSAEIVDRVVAKVNGDIITLSSVHDRVRFLSEKNKALGNINKLPMKNELIESALDTIIVEKLQLHEAKRNGFEVSEKNLDEAIADIKKNNGISDQQFKAMLENEGKSLETYKNIIRDQILVSKVVRMQMGQRSIVTNQQIKRYYTTHQNDYWEAPKVRVRHILFILEENIKEKEITFKNKKAREVLHLIRSGKDFSELARKYSEDVSAQSGGDVGVIESGMMVRQFEEAAFKLKVGEVSEVVKTRYGFHIIKCDEVFPAFTKPLNQVKEEIRNFLKYQNKQEAYQKWIKDLKRNAYIEKTLFENDHNSFTGNNNILKPKAVGLAGDEFFNDEKPKLMGNGNSQDYESIMNQLKYHKKMHNDKKISELEYQKKKKELLESF